MRPQETRRFEDETYYFDRSELVIDPHALPEYYPEVTVLQGKNVIADFFDENEGEIRGSAKENSWTQKFQPGMQIVRITTSDAEFSSKRTKLQNRTHEFDGEPTDSYDVEFDDLLILEADALSLAEGPGKVIVVPASEPLPGEPGTQWELEGVITADSKLISWDGGYMKWLVEMSLASRLIENAVDYHTVIREQGTTPSLVGAVNAASAVKKYLEYFRERYDEDFVPVTDMHMRTDEIPGGIELNLQQADRYKAKML